MPIGLRLIVLIEQETCILAESCGYAGICFSSGDFFAPPSDCESNRAVGALLGLTVACAAALVLLRRQLRARAETAGMRVVGRLTLEPRRSIYLVEVGGRRFMVGVGDGPMTMLGEVERPPLTVLAGGAAATGARREGGRLWGVGGAARGGAVRHRRGDGVSQVRGGAGHLAARVRRLGACRRRRWRRPWRCCSRCS